MKSLLLFLLLLIKHNYTKAQSAYSVSNYYAIEYRNNTRKYNSIPTPIIIGAIVNNNHIKILSKNGDVEVNLDTCITKTTKTIQEKEWESDNSYFVLLAKSKNFIINYTKYNNQIVPVRIIMKVTKDENKVLFVYELESIK
jgi:hypothetical protein